jgi:hypothetical protein
MSIETDLYTHLENDVAVSALVGDKIYPMKAPQNVTSPYITYQVINDNGNQCIGGSIYQNDTRFQIDCWSKTYSEVKAIKEAVISSLIGFKSSYNMSNMDDYEPETKLYRQLIDFKLKG